jgi:hypothetical protein
MWADPARIEFTDYAALRMAQRDITDDEVVEAMNCPCNHRDRGDGRWEVRHPFARAVLLVVYRRGTRARYVINAMWT